MRASLRQVHTHPITPGKCMNGPKSNGRQHTTLPRPAAGQQSTQRSDSSHMRVPGPDQTFWTQTLCSRTQDAEENI